MNNPYAEAENYRPSDDDWKPTGEELDAEPMWRKTEGSEERRKLWRWTWEAKTTPRQPYVGPHWYATRDLAMSAGREWLRNGAL